MLYLIKSLKWTKYYKLDTYWGPNKNGYVSVIANAGFYEEDEAKSIVSLSSGNAQMIPITKEILNKAYEQLQKMRKEVLEERYTEEERHKRVLDEFNRRDDIIDTAFLQLNNIAEQLNI